MVQMGGIYLLMIRLHGPKWIQIGGLGHRFFRRGSYAYVGSARGGVSSRLNRHLKEEKRPHWHIDYLLRYAEIEVIVYGECASDKECVLANELSRSFRSILGFGSTDCRCTSHLFFSPHRSRLVRIGNGSLKRIGLAPRLYWKKPSIGVCGLDLGNGFKMRGTENQVILG
jgi:Uri superfamily endonuclease